MTWIFAAVGLATAGLAVLAVLAGRVFTAARGLGRELDRTRGRLRLSEDELRVATGSIRTGCG